MTSLQPTPNLPPLARELLTALFRHLATTLSGVLVADGLVTRDQTQQIGAYLIGAGLFAATVAWSWVQKQQARKAAGG